MIQVAEAKPAVWLPAIKVGTGVDVFTQVLCDGLNARGFRAEIAWLSPRAEYLPWVVPLPEPPKWANIVHINTWLHRRFIPAHLPIVATMHLCVHDPLLAPYKSLAQALYHQLWVRRLESQVLRRAQRIVAVSRYTAERTEAAFGIKNVATFYNGIARVNVDDTGESFRRRPHVPFRLLYVGNWSRRKGVDLLGAIMKKLGGGFELWYTADAHGKHLAAKLPPNCKCIGRMAQSQMQQVYRDADVLIFPSRLEGLPLAVLESMANGLPVIAADSSSLAEVVGGRGAGVLCPPDDVAKFCEAIRTLSDQPSVLQQMGVLSMERIEKVFSTEIMLDKYIGLYQELIESR